MSVLTGTRLSGPADARLLRALATSLMLTQTLGGTMSGSGTNATLPDRDWTSAFGGRAVVQRTSPARPSLTQTGHRSARNPAAHQSPAVPRWAILSCEARGGATGQ